MANELLNLSFTSFPFPIQRKRWFINSLIVLGERVVTVKSQSVIKSIEFLLFLKSRSKNKSSPEARCEWLSNLSDLKKLSCLNNKLTLRYYFHYNQTMLPYFFTGFKKIYSVVKKI